LSMGSGVCSSWGAPQDSWHYLTVKSNTTEEQSDAAFRPSGVDSQLRLRRQKDPIHKLSALEISGSSCANIEEIRRI